MAIPERVDGVEMRDHRVRGGRPRTKERRDTDQGENKASQSLADLFHEES
jgi:hypothetical protein